jgi:hypothetical protein
MGTTLKPATTLLALTLTAAACFAQPQIVGSRGPYEQGVIPDAPQGGDFAASVSVDRLSYDIGQPIEISFRVTRDAYVYIFSRDPQGVERQIFPNFYDPSNLVRANRTRTIPSGGYGLQVTGPGGRNEVTLVAVHQDYPFLRDWHRFSRSEPYPSARGGAAAIAGQARSAASPRGIEAVPSHQRVAEAATWFFVGEQGHRPGGRYGSVAVQTDPRGAAVYLDGRRIGYTPVAEQRVQPGDTIVRIEIPGYWTYEREVRVQRGETSIVRLRMERLPD